MPEQNEAVVAQGDEQQLQQQVNSEEQASAEAQKGGETAGEQESQQSTDDEQQHKRLGGWQRKIQKLERQNEALLQELLRRNSQTTEPAKQKEPEELQEPDPEKFETVAEYLKAVRAYDRAQVERVLAQKLEERDKQASQKTAEQKRQETFQTRSESFKKDHPDFDEVVSDPSLPVSRVMAEQILESDLGPQIAYHLATNPEEAARISRLPEGAQIREIGKLEARLELQKPAAGEEADEQAPLPPKPKAPPPIAPVRKSAPVEKPFDPNDAKQAESMSADEWDRKYREWERQKRK